MRIRPLRAEDAVEAADLCQASAAVVAHLAEQRSGGVLGGRRRNCRGRGPLDQT